MTDALEDPYPDERLLWTGSPQRCPVLNRLDIVLVPVSLLWCYVAVHIGTFPILSAPFKQAVWVVLALIGLYLTVGRLVTRQLHLRSARYRITDRRIVISSQVLGRRHVRSVSLKDLAAPVVATRRGPSGTITFGTSTLREDYDTMREHGLTMHKTTAPPVLVEVSSPEHVRDIIASAQAALRTRRDRP